MLQLGRRLGTHTGTGALADRARVSGVWPCGEHGGQSGEVGQRLGVVLTADAALLDVDTPQQRPVAPHHRQHLLRRTLLFTLFGSSVLKPHLKENEI